MSRGGSRRGGDRSEVPQVGPDGWSVAGGGSTQRPPPKAGDLSQFGKINKPSQMTFGPSSVFAGKDKKRESISRSSSTTNMFSMLSQNPEAAAEAAAPKASRGPSRKQSVDLNAPMEAPQRRKLNLLPRSKPLEDTGTPATSEPPSEDEDEEAVAEMSEADAKKKIDEDIKEFFGIRNLEEADEYFKRLPVAHHFRLVDKLVTRAIESKEADAQLVGDLFNRAAENKLCAPEAFEEGFLPTAEILDDVAIDAPKAFDLMAIMMKGSGMGPEQCSRLAEKSMDSDKLLGLLS
jgi:translation initiation factor 4G